MTNVALTLSRKGIAHLIYHLAGYYYICAVHNTIRDVEYKTRRGLLRF